MLVILLACAEPPAPAVPGTSESVVAAEDGAQGARGSTAPPPAPDGTWIGLALGHGFACGRVAEGAASCWRIAPGYPEGTEPCVADTVAGWLGEGRRARGIAAGWEAVCIVGVDGTLTCEDGLDRLGAPPEGSFTEVVLHYGQACALGTEGAITCWGTRNDAVRGPHPGPYTDVSGSMFTACGLRRDGGVDCWGETDLLDPALMAGPYTRIDGLCGLGKDHVVRCWSGEPRPFGDTPMNGFAAGVGVCGLDTTGALQCAEHPGVSEPPPTGGGFVDVFMAGDREGACALRADGGVACWGARTLGCYRVR